VVSVTGPQEAISGQEIAVSWSAANLGPADAVGTWTDRIYLSEDGSLGGDVLLGEFAYSGSLAVGATLDRTQTVALPLDLGGSYRLIVQTDSANRIYEHGSETNNVLADDAILEIATAPIPNLRVSSVTPPATAFSEEQILVSWTVTNDGSGATSADAWYDRVYLSADATYDATDQLLGTVINPSYLGAGESYSSSLAAVLPQGIQGDYFVLVEVDATNRVNELAGEGDNRTTSSPLAVTLTPPPDLQTAGVVGQAFGFSGQPLQVRWTVTNNGPGPVTQSRWYDHIWISSDETLEGTDTRLASVRHDGGLASGESYEGSTAVTLPVGLTGSYYVFVQADGGDQVFEFTSEANNTGYDTTPVSIQLTPPPDLEVRSVDAPLEAFASAPFEISYEVTNAGSSVTPNSSWRDRFYLSSDNQLSIGSDLYLGQTTHYGALAADENYIGRFNTALPDGLQGNYYVLVATDSSELVFELDDGNNVGYDADPVTVASLPADLVVTEFTAPHTIEIGQALLATYAVLNQGSGQTPVSAWYDQVILSEDNVIGNSDDRTLASARHDGALPAQGGYSVSNRLVAIPADLQAGEYFLAAVTDATNSVYEGAGNANNVSVLVPITFTARTDFADLAVTAVSVAASGQSGTPLAVSWEVENEGASATDAGYWFDYVYLSGNTELGDTDDIYLGAVQRSAELAPGETYDVAASFMLDEELAGTFYVLVKTDSTARLDEDGNEANNATASAAPSEIALQPAVDLVVTDVTPPAGAVSGQTFELSWTVQNQGPGTAGPRSWFDSVYLSLDQNLDPSADHYVGFFNRPSELAAGASYTQTVDIQTPQGIAGPFFVIVAADRGNSIRERDAEDNNARSAPGVMQLELQPPVDLVAGTITVPANGVPGQTASITYTVENLGTQTARGTWNDSLYLSADPHWDLGDQLFATVTHRGDVPGGSSYTETAEGPLPGVAPGEYHLIVRSDIRGSIPELDESNNIAASLDQVEMDVAVLVLGEAATGSLSAGRSVYYQTAVTAGETLLISLDSASEVAVNELYVRFEPSVPSRNDYDYRATQRFSADAEAVIPATRAGTYFIMVHAAQGNTAAYSLTAEVLPFEIRAVSPGIVHNAGSATVRVEGARFDRQTVFRLLTPGGPVEASANRVDNAVLAFPTFDLTSLDAGAYDLQAEASDGTVTVFRDALTVDDGAGGELTTRIVGAEQVRPGRLYTMQIQYGNSGGSDIAAPLLHLFSPTNTPFGLTNTTLATDGISLLGVSPDGPASILRPGSFHTVTVHYHTTTNHVDISLDIVEGDDERLIDESAMADTLRLFGLTQTQWKEAFADVLYQIDGRDALPGATYGELVLRMGEAADQDQARGYTTYRSGELLQQILAEAVVTTLAHEGGDLYDVVTGELLERYAAMIAALYPELRGTPESGLSSVQTAQAFLASNTTEQQTTTTAYEDDAAFLEAMDFTGAAEGGYVNHPSDRGGATNRGVTQRTYDAWRTDQGLATQDVRQISEDEAHTIYYDRYWTASGADEMDRLTAIVQFDTAVNSGVGGANRLLADVGDGTDAERAEQYLQVRQQFYEDIVANNPSQAVFLRGWTNRVNKLRTFLAELDPAATTASANEVLAAAFDGTRPAEGTDETRAWIPLDPPAEGDPSDRNPADYTNVINQFAVVVNPRYTPRSGFTYCNIFTWDVTRAMGAEIPHWVDADGQPTGVGQGSELNANATVDWLVNHGDRFGWRQVTAEEAQRLANLGHPAVAAWKNVGGIGHMAVVRPGDITADGASIAQAGSANFNQGRVYDSFPRSADITYWVNDTGQVRQTPEDVGDGRLPAPQIPSDTHAGSTDPLGSGEGLLERIWTALRRFFPRVVRPVDPNDILGPEGYGEQRWVAADQLLSYTIRFENEPEFATAPAQQVRITQSLDEDLDWRTFRLGDFNIGGRMFEVSDEPSFLLRRLDLTETHGLFVDVAAGIDVATGEAFWNFTAVDPETGLLPADALSGLLPVNDDYGSGEGFVTYSAAAKAGVADGTVIDAAARIVFDTEEPIDTPPIFNTLDAAAPQAVVDPLPTVSPDPRFNVAWAGNEESAGSGLATYDVYVSADGGNFVPWLTDTRLTAAPFVGEAGTTYAFQAVAKDNAGNIEDLALTGETQTLVARTGTEPAADAGGPYTIRRGDSVTLDASGSADPDTLGGIAEYAWDLDGDDQFDDLVTAEAVVTLAWADLAALGFDTGVRSIGLKVTDNESLSGEAGAVVTVLDPLTVEQHIVGDGTEQRSHVTAIEIVFSSLADIDPAAFQVVRRDNGTQVTTETTMRDEGDRTIARITFVGSAVDAYGSLRDGNYELRIYAAGVTDRLTGSPLDGDEDGLSGEDHTFGDEAIDGFFRMLGDATGDRNVDALDLLKLRSAWRTRADDPNYSSEADMNGDGRVDALDLLILRRQWRQRLDF
jgi:subtilase family serine protease